MLPDVNTATACIGRPLMGLWCIFVMGASGTAAAQEPPNPFVSVQVRDNAVVATVPTSKRWLVAVGSGDQRLSVPGEAFTMTDEATLRLTERHSTYHVRAVLAPEAGLWIRVAFDARSLGGGVSSASSFVKAQ